MLLINNSLTWIIITCAHQNNVHFCNEDDKNMYTNKSGWGTVTYMPTYSTTWTYFGNLVVDSLYCTQRLNFVFGAANQLIVWCEGRSICVLYTIMRRHSSNHRSTAGCTHHKPSEYICICDRLLAIATV